MIRANTGMLPIQHGKFKIVIMDAPSDTEAPVYVRELRAMGVTDVVRTCEPTYSTMPFEKGGIQVHEMAFSDGAAPPDEVIQKWTDLISRRYRSKDQAGLVAVQCAAGLGRAPVMAAVALMEMTAMEPVDAVEKIREKQKGAINSRQLKYLQAYTCVTSQVKPSCGCALM